MKNSTRTVVWIGGVFACALLAGIVLLRTAPTTAPVSKVPEPAPADVPSPSIRRGTSEPEATKLDTPNSVAERRDEARAHEKLTSLDEGPKHDLSAAKHIDSFLAIGLGRVTASQAQARIKAIQAIPGSAAILKQKLTDGSLPEKLLSIYALIEGGGFGDELFEVVLNDPSPYVQAEALHFLLRTRQFDRVDAFFKKRLLTLDWNTVTAFLDAAADISKPALPVALTRLNLGEGLPLYLDFLAELSPSLRLAAFTRLEDPNVTPKTKSLLLRLIDSTSDQELVDRLKSALHSETNTAARIQIAQQIAARSSRQNVDVAAFLASGVGPTPEGLPPVELHFRENRIEKLRGHEGVMERVMSSENFDPVALNGALAAYLREGEMVGVRNLSRDTLDAVTAFLRERNFVYAPDIIAQGESIARKLK